LFFLDNYEEKVIPLLLVHLVRSSYGVFQLMDEIFRKYPSDIVVSALNEELSKIHRAVWCLQIALDFPDRRLAHHYKKLVLSKIRDERFLLR